MVRRASLLGSIAVAVTGCTLLVDTGDLNGGPLAGTSPSEAGTDAASADGSLGRLADAGVDASPVEDGGAFPGCPPNALLCEDFEQNGATRWTIHESGAGKIDFPLAPEGIVHGGKRSFRPVSGTATTAPNNVAELRLPVSPPRKAGTTIYYRAYVYFPGPFFHDTTISKWRTPANTTDDINLKLDLNMHLIIDADNASAGPELRGVDAIPTGKWVCIDWRATLGTPGHELVFVDGVKQIDADEVNVTAAGYDVIGAGFVAAEPDHEISVLFDDLIVSETLVGCP